MARSFVAGAVSITITLHGAPASRAASATPCAALPALTVQIPRDSSAGVSRLTAFYAPRILNDPIGCSVSSLRKISGPGRGAEFEPHERRADRRPIDRGRRVADGV